jgi:hypothetical protein
MNRDSINTEPVEGIGDGAFIHACASITTLVDEVLVSVSVQHLTTCDDLPTEVAAQRSENDRASVLTRSVRLTEERRA